MADQFVREPLSHEDTIRLSITCESMQEKFIIRPLRDCGLRISELCSLTPKHIQWQQYCLGELKKLLGHDRLATTEIEFNVTNPQVIEHDEQTL